MKRLTIQLTMTGLAAGLVLFAPRAEARATQGRPNFVFIFTDDQSFGTVAALGHPIVRTPNIDRLVRAGVSFDNAYNQGGWGGAICVASRSMLNTGRFLWNARRQIDALRPEKEGGVTGAPRIQAEAEFWSRMLKASGYTTYFTGKWHVSVPVDRLFDRVGFVRAGMPPTVPAAYNRPVEDAEDVWSPFDTRIKGHWENGRHWAELLADQAVTFIEEADRRDEPFFMYLAFNSPHDPRQSPKQYLDLYPQERMDVPANFLPENPFKDIMGCSRDLRDEKLAPFPRTAYAVRVHRREYYAIISHLDAQIGRILDALEKSGKKDNTYILLASDNGLAIGAHGLFGKQNMFEHSMKVPLILAGPDIPPNVRISAPVYLQDLVPTSLELARAPVPAHVQFKSLLPLLRNPSAPHYDAVYGGYLQLQRMIRKDGFKLILYPKENVRLLFDLEKDPDEKTNLADKPEYAAQVKALLHDLARLQQETGDTLELK
jgi:choline-sulfatase